MDTRHRKIDTCSIGHKTIFLCVVSNVTRVYLSVSCVHCYPYLSFCVLCPMLPLSIFLCLVSNVTPVYFLFLLSFLYFVISSSKENDQITPSPTLSSLYLKNSSHSTTEFAGKITICVVNKIIEDRTQHVVLIFILQ
jgi:hypothetical protein